MQPELVVTTITIVVLGLTAVETLRLRRATIKRNELSLLPFLTVYFRGENVRERKPRVRNLGYGVALDVEIEPLVITETATGNEFKMILELEETNVLKPDEERDLKATTYKNGKSLGEFGLQPYIDPQFANREIRLEIRFKNALGEQYTMVIQTRKNELRVIQPPKQINKKLSLADFSPFKLISLLR